MQGRISKIGCYLRLLRFDSWIVWVFIFTMGSILYTLPPTDRFVMFSSSFVLATIGIFILNQYFDRESDKLNALKKNLPISTGAVSSKTAIALFFMLTALSIFLVLLADVNLLPLSLVYIGLWMCYSSPPFRLKNRPIIDVITSAVGSGVLPFIMGLQISSLLTLEFALPWINRRYQDAFLSVIPIILFQSGGHIIQTVGDYEADLEGNIHTFATKYGKKASVLVAEMLLVTCALLPMLFGLLDLSLTDFLPWYLAIFLCCIPMIFQAIGLLKNPEKNSILMLRQMYRKFGPIALTLILVYALFIRISLL